MIMHETILRYLTYLEKKGRSPLTIKAFRGDLIRFVKWWEIEQKHHFDPIFLRKSDVHLWIQTHQCQDQAGIKTFNRALVSLRRYCDWAKQEEIIGSNPVDEIKSIPLTCSSPKSIPKPAVDALLQTVQHEPNLLIRLRDEVLLVLLIYLGLCVQEVCDIQIRDIDFSDNTLTVRKGRMGRLRRVKLCTDTITILQRYISCIRCPDGTPSIGGDRERELLIIAIDRTQLGWPMRQGLNQRQVQRIVAKRAREAATELRIEAETSSSQEQSDIYTILAQHLEHTTPRTLRHTLARRLLSSGTDITLVQETLGHSIIASTKKYLIPSD